MKYLKRNEESVQVAVTDDFYERFRITQSIFTEAFETSKKILNNHKDKKIALLRLDLRRSHFNECVKELEVLEKEAKEQPLLQRTKVKYGNSFDRKKGEFTKDFKRPNNVALGAVGVALLMAVSSTVLFAAILFTAGTALIPLLLSTAIVSITLLAGNSLLKRKEKYNNLENRILKEKLQKEKNRKEEYTGPVDLDDAHDYCLREQRVGKVKGNMPSESKQQKVAEVENIELREKRIQHLKGKQRKTTPSISRISI